MKDKLKYIAFGFGILLIPLVCMALIQPGSIDLPQLKAWLTNEYPAIETAIDTYSVDTDVEVAVIAVDGVDSNDAVWAQANNTYDPTNGTGGYRVLHAVPGTNTITVYPNKAAPTTMPITYGVLQD